MKLHHSLLIAPLFLATGLFGASEALAAEQSSRWLDIEIGKSYIHRETRDIARIVISDPEIAEVKSLRPGQFQVRGVKVGSTDLWVWYADDQDNPVVYQVTVHRDLSDLVRRVAQVGGDGRVRAYPLDEHIVVEGEVPDVETLEKIAEIAASHDPEFVNQMTVAGDHQVQLSVVFAEVSRTGMRELGFSGGLVGADSFFSLLSPAGTSQLNSGPEQKPYGFSSMHGVDNNNAQGNIDVLSNGAYSLLAMQEIGAFGIFGLLHALEESSLTKVLAQPTLVALSGQQAEMLSGGEVPIAVTLQDSVSLSYRDYGIKMVFVPTVLANDVVDLRVYAEVSELDQSSSIQLGSNAVPGLLTRRASSHLRLQSGMTFAMAGLLSETTSYTRSAVPLLGEIPILGALFRSTTHDREEREMMIFVTPRLVRPLAPGEVPPAPGQTIDNNPNDFEFFLMGMDHRAGSATAEPTGPIGLER